MKRYGAKTPKRTVAYSNVIVVGSFQTGKLRRTRKKSSELKEKPCENYKDSTGRKRFHGTKFLRQTQSGAYMLTFPLSYGVRLPCLRSYPVLFGRKIASILPDLMQAGKVAQVKPHMKAWADAPQCLMEYPWEDSDVCELKLDECLAYLRGAKRLRIPQLWRPFLPAKAL